MSEDAYASSAPFNLDPAAAPILTLEELTDRLHRLTAVIADTVDRSASLLSRETGSAAPWFPADTTYKADYHRQNHHVPAEGMPSFQTTTDGSTTTTAAAFHPNPGQSSSTIPVSLEQLLREAARQSELLDCLRQDLKDLNSLLENAFSGVGVNL